MIERRIDLRSKKRKSQAKRDRHNEMDIKRQKRQQTIEENLETTDRKKHRVTNSRVTNSDTVTNIYRQRNKVRKRKQKKKKKTMTDIQIKRDCRRRGSTFSPGCTSKLTALKTRSRPSR